MGDRRVKRRLEGSTAWSPAVSALPEIKSPEDLENYAIKEDCVFVALRPEDQKTFAEKGFFRKLVRNYKKSLNTACLKDVELPDDARRFVVSGWETLNSDLQALIQTKAIAFRNFTHIRRYEDLSLDECLRLLGDSHGVMVSFETVGHIAHLNLPSERLWAKHIIAKILLDKHKHIRTVVNKVKEVDNEFRTMELELLGGSDDFVAVQHENGYTFKIDFRKVYWNSRLIRERERISETFNMGDVVVDMFAGVGPFAVYAAGKGCLVFANDLNPVGTRYIEINANLNKIANMVFPYNLDARDFVKNFANYGIMDKAATAFRDHVLKPENKVHFVMNLPKDAIEFLDVLVGLAKGVSSANVRTCMVHCYCFSDAEDVEADIDERMAKVLKEHIGEKKIINGRVRTKTVKRAARQIVEKYYAKLGLDFHFNKKVAEEVAQIPSKRMRNKVAGFITHLMRRIQKGPVRGISLKLQEEERERRMDFVPERSEVDVPLIQVDQDTADMLSFLKLNIPNVKVITANMHGDAMHQRF
ncbi:tRNA (guanine(37)-N1)-methyltransferase [Babesia sp. Xinjiang]|uniref:tRNA (guanine(37)-N1)-methyltransferase n=1 Tax=Babesia sp. Xinjiang TaxID=462227 RepID=UPI000A2437F9|nr:tRNA (guanine(37)-N1)-methyltransferase [Babesia sp. Xinjiang]ORM42272.1 tRNA (guanine(37)-N1)-methyltransferase [Babesia sp. Xinjiang]